MAKYKYNLIYNKQISRDKYLCNIMDNLTKEIWSQSHMNVDLGKYIFDQLYNSVYDEVKSNVYSPIYMSYIAKDIE